jgi:hypothetical protein
MKSTGIDPLAKALPQRINIMFAKLSKNANMTNSHSNKVESDLLRWHSVL